MSMFYGTLESSRADKAATAHDSPIWQMWNIFVTFVEAKSLDHLHSRRSSD
jgi:hypothetical protein